MVVLIAGISYLGYFAIKIVGNRHGPVLTGLLGGLVSSTAVTLNLARLSKNNPNLRNALSAGILTACATMFVRSLVLTAIINPDLINLVLPALSVMSIITFLLAFILWQSMKNFQGTDELPLENPFQLGIAIKFATFLIAILFLSKILKYYYGDMGTYVLAAVSGMADVDPIILSMSQFSKQGLGLNVAVQAIFIAVSVNSLVKSMLAVVIGDRVLGLTVTGILTFAITVGLLVT